MTRRDWEEPAPSLEGHYAGVVTRGAAYIVDGFLSVAVYGVMVSVGVFLVQLVVGSDLDLPQGSPVWAIGLLLWLFVYYSYCWATAGKTPACALLGLRVVARDGSDLSARRAIVRTLVFPVSFLCFGLGFLGVLVDRERRALHDMAAGSVVVYDWDARAARLRFLSRRKAAPGPAATPAERPEAGDAAR